MGSQVVIPPHLAGRITSLSQAPTGHRPPPGAAGGINPNASPNVQSFPVNTGMSLDVRIISSVAGGQYLVSGLVVAPDGTLTPFSQPITVASSGAIVDTIIPLTNGLLVSLAISTITTAIVSGNTWCQVFIQTGITAGGLPLALLVSDYLAYGSLVGWPIGQLADALTLGTGSRTLVTAQVATWHLSITVPAFQTWLLIGGVMAVQASGISNVQIEFAVTDPTGASAVIETACSYSQPINTAVYYQLGSGIPAGLQFTGYAGIPIPANLILSPGWQIFTQDLNGRALTISVGLLVEQLIQG